MFRPPTVLSAVLVLVLVAPVAPVTAQSGDTVTLTITVRDTDGDPVSDTDLDATWEDGSTTATTAANGKAFVDAPTGATVEIAVTHPRYVRNSPYVVESASETDVEIDVYRKSTVRLEVSDDDGSVADASVVIERGGLTYQTGTTGSDGVFESETLAAGTYTVVVNKPGYYTREKSLEIEGSITNRVALRRGSVSVNVRVVDPYFDPPESVSGATVAFGDVATDRTNASGNATLTAPVNTEATLRVTRDGYRTAEREVTVGEDAEDVAVDLSRTRSITLEAINERVVAGERTVLRATNAYGDGAAVATVVLDGEQVGTTDSDGEVTVRITDPGTHTLYVTNDGVRSNEVQVEAIGDDEGATTPPGATGTEEADPTATEPTTTGTSPGFGILTVLALLAVLVVALRRR
ncbi:carboxypeptidase-like regulatory domain-containing protein [Haloplanus ruber]|uniref:Carboxypeptidase-like regulatory domain-containing protein n=1 Tax=Haloplanus ruber TaxID=869892 RepID=A0ABD6CYS4_9EURY|nr:carboxypeptidase-like regulatory domain-containing protein [Haloplanus ruber]